MQYLAECLAYDAITHFQCNFKHPKHRKLVRFSSLIIRCQIGIDIIYNISFLIHAVTCPLLLKREERCINIKTTVLSPLSGFFHLHGLDFVLVLSNSLHFNGVDFITASVVYCMLLYKNEHINSQFILCY